MSLFTYLFGKGYKGGPDFNLERTHYYDLNGIELEMTVPDSNIVFAPSNQPPTFPFKSPGWFEANCKQLANHFYIGIEDRRHVGLYRPILYLKALYPSTHSQSTLRFADRCQRFDCV